MDRVSSSDELDHYIKVTNPSAWAVLLAAFLLVAGIIVWAVVAIVPITVNTTGLTYYVDEVEKTYVTCWVNESTADKIRESGAKASIDGVEATGVYVDSTPMSSSEIAEQVGNDFYLDALHLEDWNYVVTIEPGEEPNQSAYAVETPKGVSHLVPVSIIVSEKRPINIVLGME